MHSQTLPKRGGLWKNILWLVIFILSLIVSGDISGVDIPRFLMNAGQMNIIIEKMARPDWSYVSIIVDPILETL